MDLILIHLAGPLKQLVQELQFRCLMCLFSMNRFPTWAMSPMADCSWRSLLGNSGCFSHRLMQSTTGDGKWAGICHTEESRGSGCILYCNGFLVIMPFINNDLVFINLGGSVSQTSFPCGQGLEWLLYKCHLYSGVKKGAVKIKNSFPASVLL